MVALKRSFERSEVTIGPLLFEKNAVAYLPRPHWPTYLTLRYINCVTFNSKHVVDQIIPSQHLKFGP